MSCTVDMQNLLTKNFQIMPGIQTRIITDVVYCRYAKFINKTFPNYAWYSD